MHLIFLVLILLTISQQGKTSGLQCLSLFNNEYLFRDVSLVYQSTLTPEVINVAKLSTGSQKAEFIDQNEIHFLTYHLGREKINFKFKKSPINALQWGSLFFPENHGAISNSSKIYSPEKSDLLFNQLNKPEESSADINVVAYDQALIQYARERNIEIGEPTKLNQYQLPDNVIIDYLINKIQIRFKLEESSLVYIKDLFLELVSDARIVNGNEHDNQTKFISTIRLRFKENGSGQDFDIFHIDPSISTHTLAILGRGTETAILENDNTVRFQTAMTGEISHIQGGKSPTPIIHRASTDYDKRIVLLVFMSDTQEPLSSRVKLNHRSQLDGRLEFPK